MPDIVSPKAMDVTKILSEGYANIGRIYGGMISNISNVAAKTILNLAEIKIKNYNFYKELLESMKTPEGINVVSQLHIMNSINEGKSALAKIYSKSKGWLSIEDKAMMSEIKKNVENEIVKHKTISKLVVDAVDIIKNDKNNLYDADFLNKQLEQYAEKGDVVALTETETGNPFLRIKRYERFDDFLTQTIEEFKGLKKKTLSPTDITGGIEGDSYVVYSAQYFGNKEEAMDYILKKTFEDKRAFYTVVDEMRSSGISDINQETVFKYINDKYGLKVEEGIKPHIYKEMRQAYKYGGGGGSSLQKSWTIGEAPALYKEALEYEPREGELPKTMVFTTAKVLNFNVPVTSDIIEAYVGDFGNIFKDKNLKVTGNARYVHIEQGNKAILEITNLGVVSPMGTTVENVKITSKDLAEGNSLAKAAFENYLISIGKADAKPGKKQELYKDFVQHVKKAEQESGGYTFNINNLFTKHKLYAVVDVNNIYPYLKSLDGWEEGYKKYRQQYNEYIKRKRGGTKTQNSQSNVSQGLQNLNIQSDNIYKLSPLGKKR